MNFSGPEGALGSFSASYVVELEVNAADEEPKDLASAGRLGLGHLVAQAAQDGLHCGIGVLRSLGRLGESQFLLQAVPLPLQGRELLINHVQDFWWGPKEVLSRPVNFAVEVLQLPVGSIAAFGTGGLPLGDLTP